MNIVQYNTLIRYSQGHFSPVIFRDGIQSTSDNVTTCITKVAGAVHLSHKIRFTELFF